MKTSGYVIWLIITALLLFTLFFNVHLAPTMRIAMAVLLLVQIGIVWKVVAMFRNQKPSSPSFKNRLSQNKR